MIELIFATNNAHKLDEVRAIVGDAFMIKSLDDINCQDDIPETGDTFEENAKQKTDYLVNKYGLYCFGDDSGLEIEAINNEPGVYSARYSGSRDMERNIDLVLEKLADSENRKARFRTVISLFLNEQQHFFEGAITGTIISERRGAEGFGYDPIFIPDGYDKTFAEMSVDEKNGISHRSIAVKALTGFLKSL
ncbi:non-canonical purine NTP diphosphatase [Sphingobacterium spiritivorum]|uniref:dITP/XTP pyrophosphatase n=1 Tax=Sphingobacterium spiritivorum ATCC 33861 TaxID=525373 RepID=D7VGT7_SPHSI|nr:non-canonical purine NTP diphosphatase [Sphingobacterium spiritivorum]EFK59289.1 non-canonical purine NTP pyrophosphatase, RdgB/HAM1 family [Sphingobacterium spiritivorum ATCC 33861]QQT34017.1 non-canonical purine NTP diphosphatase [Sphingobacterium spiritivorum]WQD34841.1 non-canonical purine NTP diphosphatase [Sphingobacterium spiritivorum]SUI98562.1 Non-canonical purine NTP pyrophosphatase [Sphingobacterium spiritivorum]